MALVGLRGCGSARACAALEGGEGYAFANPETVKKGLAKAKAVIDVDGDGESLTRFIDIVDAGAVALRGSIFRDAFSDQVRSLSSAATQSLIGRAGHTLDALYSSLARLQRALSSPRLLPWIRRRHLNLADILVPHLSLFPRQPTDGQAQAFDTSRRACGVEKDSRGRAKVEEGECETGRCRGLCLSTGIGVVEAVVEDR